MAPLLDQPVRVGRLLERELRTHDRAHRTAPPEVEHLARRLVHDLGTQPQQAPEVEAAHGDVAADDQGGVELRPGPARLADRDERPERTQRSEAGGEDVASDRIVGDVALRSSS